MQYHNRPSYRSKSPQKEQVETYCMKRIASGAKVFLFIFITSVSIITSPSTIITMGNRANFITIRNGAATAFYDHWAALGCLFAFAAGPDEAAAALQGMEQTNELQDWAFAEGGYLLDFDNKTAIAFGYLDVPEEMDLESSNEALAVVTSLQQGGADFLKHIAPAWKGWLLRWDERGVDAFSAYLRERNIIGISCEPDSHPPDRTIAELRG